MNRAGLPLRRGDEGPAIRDLHRRLAGAGFVAGGDPEVFDDDTLVAVRAFQVSRGLDGDGDCGRQTWAALVEADHRLGTRMLYLRSPMTRGDDITDLQRRLGSLGFDAGYVDGVFGPDTERAVRDFQANQGLTADGVAGPATVVALERLSGRRAGAKTVAEVREAEMLRDHLGLRGRRVVIGQAGGLPGLADTLARRLRLDGAEVLTLHRPDLADQARAANDWDGEVYLGLTLATEDWSVAYFATEGFVSYGGRGLAQRASAVLAETLDLAHPAVGMRLPILRGTRMPAVWCRLGRPATVVERAPSIAEALQRAVTTWCDAPVDDPPDDDAA